MEEIIIVALIFLTILLLIAVIATIYYYSQTKRCEENESPLCPRFICQNSCPAQRTRADGKTQYSDNLDPSADCNCPLATCNS